MADFHLEKTYTRWKTTSMKKNRFGLTFCNSLSGVLSQNKVKNLTRMVYPKRSLH